MPSNRKAILPLLDLDNEDTYYTVRIVKRKKDNPHMNRVDKHIRTFRIFTEYDLEDNWAYIKKMCKAFNARAYIQLRPVDTRKCAFHMNDYIGKQFVQGTYRPVLSKARYHGESRARAKSGYWSIDVDAPIDLKGQPIDVFINTLQGITIKRGKPVKVSQTVKSPNGFHLITNFFNITHVTEAFIPLYGFDVNKNTNRLGTTLLYY